MTELPSSPAVGDRMTSSRRVPGPDPVRLAGLLARAWLEVRDGRRPLAQLDPLLSPAVRRRLTGQLATPAPRNGRDGRNPPRVRRLIASTPAEGVREVTVLVEQSGRTTAIAVRMERHRGRWRAVELTAPETGLAPLPTGSVVGVRRVRDAFDEVFEEAGEPLPRQLREGPAQADTRGRLTRRGSA